MYWLSSDSPARYLYLKELELLTCHHYVLFLGYRVIHWSTIISTSMVVCPRFPSLNFALENRVEENASQGFHAFVVPCLAVEFNPHLSPRIHTAPYPLRFSNLCSNTSMRTGRSSARLCARVSANGRWYRWGLGSSRPGVCSSG